MEEIIPPELKRNFGSGDLTKYPVAYEVGKKKAYENDPFVSSSSDTSEGETNMSFLFFPMDGLLNDAPVNERKNFTFSESSSEKNISSDHEEMEFLSISPPSTSPFSQKQNKSYEKIDLDVKMGFSSISPSTNSSFTQKRIVRNKSYEKLGKTIVRKSNNNNKK